MPKEEKLLVIENCARGLAVRWFTIVKNITLDEVMFQDLFLKHTFPRISNGKYLSDVLKLGNHLSRKDFRNIFIYGCLN